MDLEKLATILKTYHQPDFRTKQINKAIFQNGISSFLEITALPLELREVLYKEVRILPFEAENVLASKDEQTRKALLKLEDKNYIETVLMSPKPKLWSVCVSSQVGCSLGCEFCATGKAGFKRNLTAEEIVGQVLFWMQHKFKIKDKINNIVFMGMGEPFLNWDNVKKGLKILLNKDLCGFGARSISVSTSGIPEGIEKLAKEFPQINLAISLHFALDEKRNQYMPINRKYNLGELKQSIGKYLQITKKKVFIEYLMLENINDSDKDAESLIRFLKSIKNNYLLHVNLIRYNTNSGILRPSSNNKIYKFKHYLDKNKISVTIRKSLGGEIFAACGQLAGKQL